MRIVVTIRHGTVQHVTTDEPARVIILNYDETRDPKPEVENAEVDPFYVQTIWNKAK